jgi:hypothetical protein
VDRLTPRKNKPGDGVERAKPAASQDYLELKVDGRTVKIASRPADGDGHSRLFELGPRPRWSDRTLLTAEDVATVVRGLISKASKEGHGLAISGVPPEAALAFPDDPRISVVPVEPMSFSLPGTPSGLILKMDDRGDGHLWALGEDRVDLGSDGMWWVVTRLIEALEEPEVASWWPRFLTLGGVLGGPAVQASLEVAEPGIRVIWRRLDNGVVGDVVAVQELTRERASGWLRLLCPVRDQLERQRVHRQRLRPAKMAEKWARALERWSGPGTA